MAGNIHIVIVESDSANAQTLQAELLKLNSAFVITILKSGEELIAACEGKKFRCKNQYVILDYVLQSTENVNALNGLEVIKIMGTRFPHVNIILFSMFEGDDAIDYDKIKDEPNVIDCINKSEYSYLILQNAIRFHYSKTNLAYNKKIYRWSLAIFILLAALTTASTFFSFLK